MKIYSAKEDSFFKLRLDTTALAAIIPTYEGVVDPSGGLFRTAEMPLTNQQAQESTEGLRAEISVQEFVTVADSHLKLTIRISIAGSSMLWGVGSHPTVSDALGIRIVGSNGQQLAERRIHFHFRVLRPGESIRVFEHFSWADLHPSLVDPAISSQSTSLHIDLVREERFWFGNSGFSNGPLTVPLIPPPLSALAATPLDLTTLSSSSPRVALTFDGGSNDRCTERLLDVLRAEEVSCTVFVTGEFIRRYPDLVIRMASDGHEIGNHTVSHPNLCFDYDPIPAAGITEVYFKEQLLGVEELLQSLLGSTPTKLWRAPYGHRNPQILSWARELGYQHVGWSIDSNDWKIGPQYGQTAKASFDRVYQMIIEQLDEAVGDRPLSKSPIVLCHLSSADANDPTYPVVQQLLKTLRTHGVSFTSVSEGLLKPD